MPEEPILIIILVAVAIVSGIGVIIAEIAKEDK